MNIEHVKAIFLLADLDILSIDQDPNPYWGSHEETYERAGPRWLVMLTNGGIVKIHRRKRVFNIDWESTQLRFPLEDQYGRNDIGTDKQLTVDDVTQGPTNVHAYSYDKCVSYLALLKRAMERDTYLRDFRNRAAIGQLTDDEIESARYYAAEKPKHWTGAVQGRDYD